jgi:hypothetical protein
MMKPGIPTFFASIAGGCGGSALVYNPLYKLCVQPRWLTGLCKSGFSRLPDIARFEESP